MFSNLAAALLLACGEPEGGFTSACPEPLVPGDLVLTEILANPAGPDRGREWVELYNASGRTLDLRGVVLESSQPDGSGARRHRLRDLQIEPERFLVLGSSSQREPLPHVDSGYGNALGLFRNTGGRLAVSCGEVELSQVVFGAMADGVAWGLDGARAIHYLAASDYENWCPARTEYASGELGTPGARNDACPRSSALGCVDGVVPRALRSPGAGELRISELMPRSGVVPDASGEWIELEVLADVDLNGVDLVLDGGRRATLSSDDGSCLAARAGSFVILARSEDPAENGQLPTVDFKLPFFLPNTGTRTLSLHSGEELIDAISYHAEQVRRGASILRDPESGELCTTPREELFRFGAGDFGTPGAANPPCARETPEVSPEVEPRAPDEERADRCEDVGGLRARRPPEIGRVRISELMPKSGSVPDARGEWLELEVLADVDLNGLQIVLDGERTLTLAARECLSRRAGSFVILARSDDPNENGGLPPIDAALSFHLPNTGARRLSLRFGETTIDEVSYTSELVRAGTSITRDPDSEVLCLTPRDPEFRFGAGDYGSPGVSGPACEDESGPLPSEGSCVDEDGERALVTPLPGGVLIREILPNCQSPLLDRDCEWFSLETLADVDLNGLEVLHDDQLRVTLGGPRCLFYPAGSIVLFARSSDPDLNGGLQAVDFTFRFNLVNRPAQLSLRAWGQLIDRVDYPNPPRGRSLVFDRNQGVVCVSPREPELEYFPSHFGTPGAMPGACP